MKWTNLHIPIAEAFLGPRPEGKEVNHKDLNKTNCRPDNLEYLTKKEHEAHSMANGRKANSFRELLSNLSPTRRLTKEQVIDIRSLKSIGFSAEFAANAFKVSPGHIRKIWSRAKWGWL